MKKDSVSADGCTRRVEASTVGDAIAAWWDSYSRDYPDQEGTRVAFSLLTSPDLRGYWNRVRDELATVPEKQRRETAAPWLMDCFVSPAEDELHVTGTHERPTRKVRLRKAHTDDRKRAGRAAKALREALKELGGWRLPPRPDEVLSLASLVRRCNLPLADPLPSYFEGIRTSTALGKLAGALEGFADTDALAGHVEFDSQKASWRDYVRVVSGTLVSFAGTLNVDVHPSMTEWETIVFTITGARPLPKDIRELVHDK